MTYKLGDSRHEVIDGRLQALLVADHVDAGKGMYISERQHPDLHVGAGEFEAVAIGIAPFFHHKAESRLAGTVRAEHNRHTLRYLQKLRIVKHNTAIAQAGAAETYQKICIIHLCIIIKILLKATVDICKSKKSARHRSIFLPEYYKL